MKLNIFREYDIRGVMGEELNIEETYDLAKSIITYYKKINPKTSDIIIARDGRSHSLAIKENMIRAITDLGLNVIDIDLCPTPVLYYSLHNLTTPTGMIITASHNPGKYNGIKICLDKKAVWGKQIQEIKNIYQNKSFYQNKTNKKGTIKLQNMIPEYINYLCNHFKHLKNSKLNAVIDCGNGTAGTVFPQIIKKMNWTNIKLLFETVDGNFPNHEADPTVMKNMQDVIEELKNNSSLELGLGLDGDCDRMNPITKSGYLVPGDQLLAIYAQKVLKNHPGTAVVFDIKASSSLINLLKSWGAKDCISPSGHALIKESMAKNNAKLAGELSCHFFFNDRYFGYDDGIYATFRLFEILEETKQNLDELIKIFPKQERSSEIRISCPDSRKHNVVESVKNIFAARKDAKTITIDGVRAQLNYGWGLVRVSNTQPVICLRFESDSKEGLKKIKKDFFQALKPHFEENFLREQIEL